jgi:hypothetical protein
MNCSHCRDELAAFIEGLSDQETAGRIERHMADCPACRTALDEVRGLVDHLLNDGRAGRRVSLEAPVMDRIAREQVLQTRRLQMRKRIRLLGVAGAVAVAGAALLALVGPWAGPRDGRAEAAEVLAEGAEAVSGIRSIHLRCLMRTPSDGNFQTIMLQHPLAPVELWKQFGNPPKVRLEKPGRVAVNDGRSTTELIHNRLACLSPADAPIDPMLENLMDVDKIIGREIRSAMERKSELKLTHEKGDHEAEKLVVTVESKAGAEDDWLKDQLIAASDNRRVYRFDAKTRRLDDLKIYVHAAGGNDVLVFEVKEIHYDSAIDPSLFSLDLPEGVVRYQKPAELADNRKYEGMTPQQAARAFFEACAEEDWDEVKKFLPVDRVDERIKDIYGGLEIVRIGEPFKSGHWNGWFVPYELKQENGRVRKHNLALKKRAPANRYIVAGGF